MTKTGTYTPKLPLYYGVVDPATPYTNVVTVDPRAGGGLVGAVNSIVMRLSGGIKQVFRKFGAANTDWQLVSPPSFRQATGAADMQDIVRESVGNPVLAASPTHLWVPRPALVTAQVPDLIGTAHLLSGGVEARRNTVEFSSQEITMMTRNAAGAYWGVAAAGQLNFAAGSWAFGMAIKFLALGTGSFYLGKNDNLNNGYYALGFDALGQLGIICRDTAAVAVNVGALGNLVDDAWHTVIAGRDATAGFLYVQSDLSGGNVATGVLGSLANPTAVFGFLFNLFGAPSGGADLQCGALACWEGAAAENVLANRGNLCLPSTGLLAV